MLLILILTSTIGIIFFKDIEYFMLYLNFSWTLSKITPYFVLIVLGLLLAKKSSRKLIFKVPFLNKILLLLIILSPFAIGFAIHPIYEGDFSKTGNELKTKEISDFKNYDFIVLTIPGCKYCHESVSMINKIQERNSNMQIKYIVCNKDMKEISPFSKNLNQNIKVNLVEDIDVILKINNGKFPCFIMNKKNSIYFWFNNQFGTRAKDFLEQNFKE